MSTGRRLMGDTTRKWITTGVVLTATITGLGHCQAPTPQQAPPPPASQAPAETLAGLSAADAREETATHEAGHVAALREFGIPVWSVTLNGTGGGETRYPARWPGTPRAVAHQHAVVDAAGQQAAVEWLVRRGWERDRALTATEPEAGSDLSALTAHTTQAGISAEEAQDQAREVVRTHQRDIDRTAQHLIELGGKLDRRDLDRELGW